MSLGLILLKHLGESCVLGNIGLLGTPFPIGVCLCLCVVYVDMEAQNPIITHHSPTLFAEAGSLSQTKSFLRCLISLASLSWDPFQDWSFSWAAPTIQHWLMWISGDRISIFWASATNALTPEPSPLTLGCFWNLSFPVYDHFLVLDERTSTLHAQ